MKYSKELTKKICKNLELGNTIIATCEAVGISKVTFYDWMDKKAYFSNCIKKAQSKAVNVVETALFKMATGQFAYVETHEEQIFLKDRKKDKDVPAVLKKTIKKTLAPNPTAFVFFLVNRSEEWENIQGVKHSGSVEFPITAEDVFTAIEKAKELKAKEEEKANATNKSKTKPGGKGSGNK